LTNSSAQAQANAQQARINLSTTLASAANAKEQANSAQNVLGQLTAAQARTDAFNKQLIDDAAALESNAEAKAAALRTEAEAQQAKVIALSKDAQTTQAQLAAAQAESDVARAKANDYQFQLVEIKGRAQASNDQATAAQKNVSAAQERFMESQSKVSEASETAKSYIVRAETTLANNLSAFNTAQAGAQAAIAELNALNALQESAANAAAAARAQAASIRDVAAKAGNQLNVYTRMATSTAEQVRYAQEQVAVAQANAAVAQSAVDQLTAASAESQGSVDEWVINEAIADLAIAQKNIADSLAIEQSESSRLSRFQAAVSNFKSQADSARESAVASLAAAEATSAALANVQAGLSQVQAQADAAQAAVVTQTENLKVAERWAADMRTEAENLEANAKILASNSSAELESAHVKAKDSIAQLMTTLGKQASIQRAVDDTTRVAQESAKSVESLTVQATTAAAIATDAQARVVNAQAAADDARNQEVAAEGVLEQLLAVQKSNPDAVNLKLIEDTRVLLAQSQKAALELTAAVQEQQEQAEIAQAKVANIEAEVGNAQLQAAEAQAQADAAQADAKAAGLSVADATAQLEGAKDAMKQAQLIHVDALNQILEVDQELGIAVPYVKIDLNIFNPEVEPASTILSLQLASAQAETEYAKIQLQQVQADVEVGAKEVAAAQVEVEEAQVAQTGGPLTDTGPSVTEVTETGVTVTEVTETGVEPVAEAAAAAALDAHAAAMARAAADAAAQADVGASALKWTLMHVRENSDESLTFRGDSGIATPGTLMFRKGDVRYPHLARNEDGIFLRDVKNNHGLVVLDENYSHLFIRVFHGSNTWEKDHFLARLHRRAIDWPSWVWSRWIMSDVTRHRAFKLSSREKDSLQQMTHSFDRGNELITV
jgi:hypothetical protein